MKKKMTVREMKQRFLTGYTRLKEPLMRIENAPLGGILRLSDVIKLLDCVYLMRPLAEYLKEKKKNEKY